MRKQEIRELIKILEESGINELEVWEGRRKIRIAKVPTGAASVASAPAAPMQPTASDEVDEEVEPRKETLASNLKQIVSPMVGTFYRSPGPGSEPFIEIGQPIDVGQTVCIVEAMKLMNEIGSDFNGVVRKVLIDNAQPVEYGQPLFLVETK